MTPNPKHSSDSSIILCGSHGSSMDSQDPRLEAAKPKGRGTADASEKALEVGMGR